MRPQRGCSLDYRVTYFGAFLERGRQDADARTHRSGAVRAVKLP